MVRKITLPSALVGTIAHASRRALITFAQLEPEVDHFCAWLSEAYSPALVGEAKHWPSAACSFRDLVDVQDHLARVQDVARRHDGELVDQIVFDVHVAEITDQAGASGYGPIDVSGASLGSRVLSLLVVDVLMNPTEYAALAAYARRRAPMISSVSWRVRGE